ncbi:nucleotide exchange factor GrpE [Romboutsia lituseburensis]|uniref:Protein GrpE n=2 Tax=root TaxID=1 RepID=A0A1G9NZG9_9FIRM|nr:nucleotide exchange factor GrpE [Romboutsia lituseburensis]CEH33171.1 Protein GrpE [Romboutsia lituseburensis]SDL91751.1 molecular chaperone GrpE [Romboutsia lituseburensis DSM 797]
MQENNIEKEELKEEMDNSEQETTEETVEQEEITEETNCDDNITDINEKLEEKKLQDEIDKVNEQYQRLQAEYANYRRRTQQEKETIGLFANEKILNDLIPVIDSMERALEACEDKEDSMYKGIDLVYKQLQDTLNKFGVEEIEALDQEFDPNLHLAVMQEVIDGVEANKVVMVLQKGYKLGSKVLRASMVKVSC